MSTQFYSNKTWGLRTKTFHSSNEHAEKRFVYLLRRNQSYADDVGKGIYFSMRWCDVVVLSPTKWNSQALRNPQRRYSFLLAVISFGGSPPKTPKWLGDVAVDVAVDVITEPGLYCESSGPWSSLTDPQGPPSWRFLERELWSCGFQIPPEVRCFRYVFGVQIPPHKVFGSLGLQNQRRKIYKLQTHVFGEVYI